jgi:Skp family chaperone for outer membrane proteins
MKRFAFTEESQMKTRIAALMIFAALLGSPTLAHAQDKMAVVNPIKIFNESQERKDLQARLDEQAKAIQAESENRSKAIQELQKGRDALAVGSSQYNDRNKEVIKATVEAEVWIKMVQADAQRNQKHQIKALFDKIQATTAEVAKSRGIQLVLTDNRPEIPELDKISTQDLVGALRQQDVMYVEPKLDLTAEIIAMMDSKYKNNR